MRLGRLAYSSTPLVESRAVFLATKSSLDATLEGRLACLRASSLASVLFLRSHASGPCPDAACASE